MALLVLNLGSALVVRPAAQGRVAVPFSPYVLTSVRSGQVASIASDGNRIRSTESPGGGSHLRSTKQAFSGQPDESGRTAPSDDQRSSGNASLAAAWMQDQRPSSLRRTTRDTPRVPARTLTFMPCVFCERLRGGPLTAASEDAAAFADAFPVSPGHTLVVSRRHEANFFALRAEERAALWALAAVVIGNLADARQADGFNVGLNAGAAAGQTVMHAHVHVIPRYAGDVEDAVRAEVGANFVDSGEERAATGSPTCAGCGLVRMAVGSRRSSVDLHEPRSYT